MWLQLWVFTPRSKERSGVFRHGYLLHLDCPARRSIRSKLVLSGIGWDCDCTVVNVKIWDDKETKEKLRGTKIARTHSEVQFSLETRHD